MKLRLTLYASTYIEQCLVTAILPIHIIYRRYISKMEDVGEKEAPSNLDLGCSNCAVLQAATTCSSEPIPKFQNGAEALKRDQESRTCHKSRALTEEERAKLERDTNLVSEFKQGKLEKEAQKNWDLFYKRNTTKFYKDRHWTLREFEELCGSDKQNSEDDKQKQLVVLEVGCGVGNFIFPLIQETPHFFYACDFSPRAVQFVQENPLYSENRCKAFWCDITTAALTDNVPKDGVDIVSMVFVLSAIHPDKMLQVLTNIHSVLKPGGCVLFRDYGLYDHAQLRFSSGHKLLENFYVRQDGTRAYYFSVENLSQLFQEAGFQELTNSYVHRETVNKKEGLCVPRVFVQAKFCKQTEQKTAEASDAVIADLCQHKPTS